MLARARPAATPSSSSPMRNRRTTIAASSVAPMKTAPTAAIVISVSIENGVPVIAAATARRAIGTSPTTMAATNAQCPDLRQRQADQIRDGERRGADEDEHRLPGPPPRPVDDLAVAVLVVVPVLFLRPRRRGGPGRARSSSPASSPGARPHRRRSPRPGSRSWCRRQPIRRPRRRPGSRPTAFSILVAQAAQSMPPMRYFRVSVAVIACSSVHVCR